MKKETIDKEGYRVINLTISKVDNKKTDERKVVIFEYNHWKKTCPSLYETTILYKLIEDLNNTENNKWGDVLKTNQIVVHCGTDISRSIIFVSLDAMMRHMICTDL